MAKRIVSWMMLLAVLAAVGCETKGGSSATTKPGASLAFTPRDLLDKMLAVYKGATAYRDEGIVRLSYKHGDQPLEDTAPLSVEYAAPNRLRVRAYQTDVASDGKFLHAEITDPTTANLDGQFVRRAAPAKLSLDELYADAVLHDALQSGLGRHPVQLELLFGDAPLVDLLKPDAKLSLLPPTKDSEGHHCQRLAAELADGTYTFWIDSTNYVLHRIEYPAQSIVPQLANDPQVSDLKLVADFRGAKFEKTLPAEDFALAIPPNAKQVRQFVLPPQELPTELFGLKPGDFQLTTADGDTVSATGLAGKIAVLMWFSNDPACQTGLQQLSQGLSAVKNPDKVTAYVIATEDRQTPSAELQAALKAWNVDVPLLRDFEVVGRDTFGLRNAPTLIVLDASGRVQIFEEGANPRLNQTLPVIIERLLAGDDLAEEILADAKKSQEQYGQSLASASGETTQTSVIEIPEAKAAPPSKPQHFELTKLWSTMDNELAEPGNFLVVEGESTPKTYVLDGWRTVVELDAAGKTVKKQTLDLPERAGVSYLRTATTKDGQRVYVGSALLAQQLFVMDDKWNVTLRYPPEDQPHEGLHAVELADLANDGTPELYVGYWSLIGVQGVSLTGKKEWSNRVIPTVLSLVATPPNDLGWRKLIASGDRGVLYRINQYGLQDPKIEIPGRQIHRLAANKIPALATAYCGVSYQDDGRLLAVGLDAELAEVWNYKLPVGQFNNQIEYVTSGRVRDDEQGEWIIAGPDGSVHIISDDGEFSDAFATGELLTGLAFVKLGDQRVILTSSKGKVTAWGLIPH